MPQLLIHPELTLGLQELSRGFKYPLDKLTALIKQQTGEWGILKDTKDIGFNNFKVDQGVNLNTISIPESFAIDSNGNLIYYRGANNIAVPLTGSSTGWWWIKIAYQTSSKEIGKVNIDSSGNLTGFGTKFTEVLRGNPNSPVKVIFHKSGLVNQYEYEVVEVLSDTSAVISGDLASETDLEYSVIGNVSPYYMPSGVVGTTIYSFDSCLLSFVDPSSTPETQPSKVDGIEFFIAKIKIIGSTIKVEDKRTEFYKTIDQKLVSYVNRNETNPVFGVEGVTWLNSFSTNDKNRVFFSWGVRSKSWNLNTNTRSLSLILAEGGRFKDTSLFNDGEFDNWRIYFPKTGVYKIISESIKVGGNISLIIDGLNPSDLDLLDEVVLVPNVEEIEVMLYKQTLSSSPDIGAIYENLQEKVLFPINNQRGYIDIVVDSTGSSSYYGIKYRYKNNGDYGVWKLPLGDSVGYFDESSYDEKGILKAPSFVASIPYLNPTIYTGFLTFNANPNSYYNFISRIYLGDIASVTTRNLSNSTPLISLKVGEASRAQIFYGNNLNLSTDQTISLLRESAQNGNRFVLIFKGTTTPNTKVIRIMDNFVSGVSAGSELFRIELNNFSYMKYRQVVLEFWYDGDEWHLIVLEESEDELGDIKMHVGVTLTGNFDNTGKGIRGKYLGRAIADGNNGTVNLSGKFLVGFDSSDSDFDLGDDGGSKTHTLTIAEMPSHNHTTNTVAGGDVDQGEYGLVRRTVTGENKTVDTTDTDQSGIEPDVTKTPQDIPFQGDGDAFPILPPFYTVLYTQRIF